MGGKDWYLSGGVEGVVNASGDGERVGGINTTCGFVGTVMGVMSVVLRRVGGECGGEVGRSASGSLGSRKESGGIKTGLPR